ncbi:YihY family inner membrane protein [Brevundimonas diminuta]|uniref:YihY family inner membrane protein n=3 Tax=Pseudomonadota TaxID=1224 RepID=A0A2X1CBI2_BREDI|nr:YihY/virulence factor BrkB family protein [Brevundimonas diminuta]EGF94703.1 ribonuclease BN-like family protein [Brevundimonas diminuta ATCC 11568]WQE46521.1 YihY/virulence factor BrkB family protein [Brevundimonas diminuta]SPU44026.1 YihY family inner membrane protein [Brevundimonas diminuta]SPU48021.1 YihY family inner membrane protein [Brevundimonas diminuta]SUW15775.1 YihY family inner membrane protein [Brevundimonas diminuta]
MTFSKPITAQPRLWLRLMTRAFSRSWGRDVMLYTGGVSFFALLALFPAIAILIGFYKAVLTIGQVSEQAAALADVIPSAARTLFLNEIDRLANASARTVSAQSAIALVIGAYAAHRGFKALLAGLNLIHDETNPLGFFKFNMLAFLVALAAFVLFTIVSGAVVTSRLMEHAYADQPVGWLALPLDGLWPALGLWLGLTMLYRYAMAHAKRVAWKAAIIGGLVATVMSTFFSWLCTIYVEQIVHLGATYGSVGAVVVLLIWLSWNVNAVFYGGAFATELEIEWETRAVPPEPAALPDTVVNLSERRQSRQ